MGGQPLAKGGSPSAGSWSCGGRGWVSTHWLRVAVEGRGVWASEVWEAGVTAGCRRQHGVGAVQKLVALVEVTGSKPGSEADGWLGRLLSALPRCRPL